MRRELEAPARSRGRWPAVLLLTAALGGACASTGSVEQAGMEVTVIAEELVESARQRVELSQLRVVVRDIRELVHAPVVINAGQTLRREDPIGAALEHDFVTALAGRLNVVESELLGPAVQQTTVSTLSELASSYGATHLLVGEYQRSGDALVVSVRLIDAASRIIVAAARGRVSYPDLEPGGPGYFGRLARSPESTAPVPLDAAPSQVVMASPGAGARVEAPRPAATPGAGGSPAIQAATTGPDVAPEPLVSSPASSADQPAPPAAPIEDFETWKRRQQLERAAEVDPAVQEAPATSPPAPGRPIEDFETWWKRRLEERASSEGEPAGTVEGSAGSTSSGANPDSAPALSRQQPQPTGLYPWRSNGRLAELLGIPRKQRPRDRP